MYITTESPSYTHFISYLLHCFMGNSKLLMSLLIAVWRLSNHAIHWAICKWMYLISELDCTHSEKQLSIWFHSELNTKEIVRSFCLTLSLLYLFFCSIVAIGPILYHLPHNRHQWMAWVKRQKRGTFFSQQLAIHICMYTHSYHYIYTRISSCLSFFRISPTHTHLLLFFFRLSHQKITKGIRCESQSLSCFRLAHKGKGFFREQRKNRANNK